MVGTKKLYVSNGIVEADIGAMQTLIHIERGAIHAGIRIEQLDASCRLAIMNDVFFGRGRR